MRLAKRASVAEETHMITVPATGIVDGVLYFLAGYVALTFVFAVAVLHDMRRRLRARV